MFSRASFQLVSRRVAPIVNRCYHVVRAVPVRKLRPWEKHVFIFGVGVAGTKAALADVCVQKRIEKVKAMDWRRVKVFCLFGAAFCGVWQYFLYNKLFPRLVPDIDRFLALSIRQRIRDVQGLKGIAIQCSIDNFINNAIFYFPAFYTVKLYLEGSSSLNPMIGVRRYLETWREDMWNILIVWIPAQTFNFFFCPMWARVSFTALISFGFTAYVSLLRGAPDGMKEVSKIVTKMEAAIGESMTQNKIIL